MTHESDELHRVANKMVLGIEIGIRNKKIQTEK